MHTRGGWGSRTWRFPTLEKSSLEIGLWAAAKGSGRIEGFLGQNSGATTRKGCRELGRVLGVAWEVPALYMRKCLIFERRGSGDKIKKAALVLRGCTRACY